MWQLCCEDRAMCSTVSCATGTVADPLASTQLCAGAACDNTGADNAQCCDDQALCSTITCGTGTISDPSADGQLCLGAACDNTGADNQACCNPRAACSTIGCAPGTVADPLVSTQLCAGSVCDHGGMAELTTSQAQALGFCMAAVTNLHCLDESSGSIAVTCDTSCLGGVWAGQAPAQTADNALCCADRSPCDSITCFDRTVADPNAAA